MIFLTHGPGYLIVSLFFRSALWMIMLLRIFCHSRAILITCWRVLWSGTKALQVEPFFICPTRTLNRRCFLCIWLGVVGDFELLFFKLCCVFGSGFLVVLFLALMWRIPAWNGVIIVSSFHGRMRGDNIFGFWIQGIGFIRQYIRPVNHLCLRIWVVCHSVWIDMCLWKYVDGLIVWGITSWTYIMPKGPPIAPCRTFFALLIPNVLVETSPGSSDTTRDTWR